MTKLLLTFFAILWATLSFGQVEINKTVYFDFNVSTLGSSGSKSLDSIVQQLSLLSGYDIMLSGHTDSIGSNAFNDKLSGERVNAVKNYLISKSVDGTKIVIDSFGRSKPIVVNNSDRNRALNRRVEIAVIGKKVVPVAIKQEAKQQTEFVISYGSSTVGGGIGISTITNTEQMEKRNFTTMTEDGMPLTSNLMFCTDLPQGTTDCNLKEPITIKLPVNTNSGCRNFSSMRFYDAVKGPVTEEMKWKEVPRAFDVDTIEGREYFVVRITNVCGARCKNMDCPCQDSLLPIAIKIKTRKLKVKTVHAIYENSNALLTGKKTRRYIWTVNICESLSGEFPIVKVVANNKTGGKYNVRVSLQDLKKGRKGIYILSKKGFTVEEPTETTSAN